MLKLGTMLTELCGSIISKSLADRFDLLTESECLASEEDIAKRLLSALPASFSQSDSIFLVRAAMNGAKRVAEGKRPSSLPATITESLREPGRAGGPGTMLKWLIGWFATEREGCRCKERSRIMDRWGVALCRKRIDTVVSWLAEEAAARFGAGASMIPRSVYKAAVSKACDMAEGIANDDDISLLNSDDPTGSIESGLLESWPFVWTYYGAEAVGDELKFSIRSVLHHWPEARVIVIGDKPDWYTGEMIVKPRIGKTDHRAFKDCFSKVLHMTDVLPQFTWMMDDIYFLDRVPMKDVTAPKYVRHVTQQRFHKWKPSNKWGKTRQRAYQWLLDRNRPTYDFASHLPQPIDSTVFKAVNDEARFMDEYKNWECCYLNSYRTADAQDWGRRFLRVTKKMDSIVTDRPVLNHTHRFFSGAVEAHLNDMFPDKSRVEL